jgi:hypothetical protein
MRTILRTLKVSIAMLALFVTASLVVATFIAPPADARVGVGRPGVGVGRVGSGLGFRPGVGVGRAGIGVGGWRGGLGYGYGRGYGYRGLGYGAAALTGAALGYGAANYGYGYEEPYGYTGLYSYSPGSGYGGGTLTGYTLIQFDGGHCEVWSNANPSGSGMTILAADLPNWDAGEAAYHSARAQGVCH